MMARLGPRLPFVGGGRGGASKLIKECNCTRARTS
jgi:hypothetical protein